MIALASDDKSAAEMNECAFAAVATETAGAEWKWIAGALVVDAIIVACAIFIPIFIPELRSKMRLGAALVVFMTALAVAFLLPPRLCVGLGGWLDVSLGVRIFVAGVGLVVALILASFAREWGDGGPSIYGFTEDSQGNVEPRYDVELISVGTKPRRVARTVASFTDLRNEEAKGLLRTAPVFILRNASYATAEGAREALERLGATVEVRAYEVDTPGLAPQPSTPPTWWLTHRGS
jgi:ribosomal protein L7/L12